MSEAATSPAPFVHPSQLGHLLVVGFSEPRLTPKVLDYLHCIEPGAVILFRRNVPQRIEQLVELIEQLHALPWNPLVSIDHEGGRVTRLSEPFTHFPPMAFLGKADSEPLAYSVGHAMGLELASVGIDLVYAPVLDVASCANNPVLGDRAFSAKPEKVARLGCALASGLADGGVLACGKHFPGHGDTVLDSHFALPTVTASRELLLQREIVPFRAAIAAGVPAIMTAHVVYPALDPRWPATLSREILHRLLREELGFPGLVLSDDLEMAAIAQRGDLGAAAVRALQAGADGLLVCQSEQAALHVRGALIEAWEAGKLSADTVTRALGHWQVLRSRRLRKRPTCPLPCEEHRRLAAAVERVQAD